MINVLELDTGWTECDICGNGNGHIRISASENTESYNIETGHRCHGRIDLAGLSRDELIATVHQWKFLAHTRYARNTLRRTLVQIDRGEFAPGGRRNRARLERGQRIIADPFQSTWAEDAGCAERTAPCGCADCRSIRERDDSTPLQEAAFPEGVNAPLGDADWGLLDLIVRQGREGVS